MRHVQGGDTSYDNGYMYSQESDIEMHVSCRQRNSDRNFTLRFTFPLLSLFIFFFFLEKSYPHRKKTVRTNLCFRQDPVSSWTWYATQCQLERCQLYRRYHFRCSSRIYRCSPWSPSILIHCQKWSASRSILRRIFTALASLSLDMFARKVMGIRRTKNIFTLSVFGTLRKISV